jgi:hypothetical protein
MNVDLIINWEADVLNVLLDNKVTLLDNMQIEMPEDPT